MVWTGQVGAAACTDTMLVTDAGPHLVTPVEVWPVKRIRVGGIQIDRPDILIR